MKMTPWRMGAVLAVAALLVCLGGVVARAGYPSSVEQMQTFLGREDQESRLAEADEPVRDQAAMVAEAMERWQHSLAQAEFEGKPLSTLAERLEPIARDTSAIHWGGTGSRRVYFLIDDFVRIHAEVDGRDIILLSPMVEPAGLWLKDGDGTMLTQPYPKGSHTMP